MTNLNLLNERYPNIDFAYIIDTINNALPNAINSVQAVMTDIVPMIYNAGMSIISWIINIILAFVISCYLMSSKHRIIHGMKRIIYALFDQKTAYKVIFTIKECNHIFGQYIIGKALDSLIIGIICFVLMCILQSAVRTAYQYHRRHYQYDPVLRSIYRGYSGTDHFIDHLSETGFNFPDSYFPAAAV